MKKAILLVLLTAFMACKKEADFTKVQKGMDEKQVVELVGDPAEKNEIPMIGTFYKYEKYTILFHQGKVTRCETKEKFAEGMAKAFSN